MSKKKHPKSSRPQPPSPDSYGEEILDALERAGAPLTRQELMQGLTGSGRARAAGGRERPLFL
ncbi:MAG: hypothetical protein ACREB3_09120, partial [Burkholderiales bacterium]